MKMIFSVDRRPRLATGDGDATEFWGPAAGAGGARLMWARAAMRIFSVMSVASWRIPSATPIFGLATKSTAPNSSAFRVTSAPRSVKVETITTGMGRRRIKRDRKSMPSMRGISTSSVMTSGLRLRIISRAINGSLAAPTHSMSGCLLMISVRMERTSAESSTTTTVVLAILFGSSEEIDGSAAMGHGLNPLHGALVLLQQGFIGGS